MNLNTKLTAMIVLALVAFPLGSVAEEKPQEERKVKYWVAPMDPTYIRDEPGQSPMGMDLVPVYEDEAPSGATISIDPVTVQSMGVRTAPVEVRDLHRTLRTSGIVGFEEPRQYTVNSKIDGWVERLYVNETGQAVKKGQPLLELYSPQLVTAQEEYLLALRNRQSLKQSAFPSITEGADRLLESTRKRLRYWDISDRQIRHLEKTGQVRKTLTLYAPYRGIVTMRMATEGQFVKAGMKLFDIADLRRVWVLADIYEYELPWVREGQSATVILPYGGGQSIPATIEFLYPTVEPKTRTVKARLVLDNPELALKPEMYVSVRIQTQPVKDAVAVPAEAVLHSGETQRVFVSLGEGKFEPREVETGLQSEDGYLEITRGLQKGDLVVTSAQFMLDSESKLREAIQKMLEPAAADGGDDLEDLFGDEEEEALDALFE